MIQNRSYEQLIMNYKRMYSGENKRDYILQYSPKILVAAAGFEPTTFGLWAAISIPYKRRYIEKNCHSNVSFADEVTT